MAIESISVSMLRSQKQNFSLKEQVCDTHIYGFALFDPVNGGDGVGCASHLTVEHRPLSLFATNTQRGPGDLRGH